jgi:nicotinate-nucleotide--dimethylbenzimidazole phosphoribosyltransferase
LLVASRIATPVTDYCVFARSHYRNGLNMALSLFQQGPIIELGLDSTDGTGASLAWPLLHSAAALLTEVAEGDSPGPTLPGEL